MEDINVMLIASAVSSGFSVATLCTPYMRNRPLLACSAVVAVGAMIAAIVGIFALGSDYGLTGVRFAIIGAICGSFVWLCALLTSRALCTVRLSRLVCLTSCLLVTTAGIAIFFALYYLSGQSGGVVANGFGDALSAGIFYASPVAFLCIVHALGAVIVYARQRGASK